MSPKPRSFLLGALVFLAFWSATAANQNADSASAFVEDLPAAPPALTSAPSQDLKTTNVDQHMVVLTMDGTLHCVGQRSGSLLWRTKDEPLIKVYNGEIICTLIST